jgi:hypothetical protein
MLRRALCGIGAATLAISMSATIVLAGNPAGHGQPSAGCGDPNATVMPNGFLSGGFAVADSHYANPGSTGGVHSSNAHVVAQYDVACYQLTQQQH